jgi:single-strand DNA-binding protein
MASFNKVILAGNLTKDPEIRDVVTRGGDEFSVCDFSLAVNRRGKNASQDADYFLLSAYSGLGEALFEHKRKGDALLVGGHAEYQAWEDRKTGDKRSRIVVVAEKIQYIDSAGRGVNKVFLAGNLTKDPQVRYTPEGTRVASFGLAVNRIRTEGVDFFDVCAFEDLAGIVADHKAKGDGVIVEGRLRYDLWEDKHSGGKRSKVSVVASNVEFTSVKANDARPAPRSRAPIRKGRASRTGARSGSRAAGRASR